MVPELIERAIGSSGSRAGRRKRSSASGDAPSLVRREDPLPRVDLVVLEVPVKSGADIFGRQIDALPSSRRGIGRLPPKDPV